MSRPGFLTYALIVRLLTMSIVWLVLLIWHFNAYRAGCGATLGFLGVLALFLLVAGVEKSLLHRQALFDECVGDEDRLFVFFHSRVLMIARELVIALFLAAVLLISALLFEPRQWSLLFVDLMLLTLLIPRITAAMSEQVRPRYRFAMARQWVMWISLALLWGEALLVTTLSPSDYFGGMRWQEVVTYGVSQPEVQCALVGDMAHVYVVGEALAVWAVQNASRVMNDPTQAIMVWVGYLALVGFSLLVALAYSRALVGVMGRPWELWASRRTTLGGREPRSDTDGSEGPASHATGAT